MFQDLSEQISQELMGLQVPDSSTPATRRATALAQFLSRGGRVRGTRPVRCQLPRDERDGMPRQCMFGEFCGGDCRLIGEVPES